jgi:hypothetical protein
MIADISQSVEDGRNGNQSKRNYQFVLNGWLGPIPRWLRALGLDTECVSS